MPHSIPNTAIHVLAIGFYAGDLLVHPLRWHLQHDTNHTRTYMVFRNEKI
jgi:hypothetical protein